ncbi:MAG TPA: hypothetical protein VF777_02580 [Phycisphaerales bacterium]
MSRLPHQSTTGRLLMPSIVVLLILLSLFKRSWLGWVNSVANIPTAILTPGSAVVSTAAGWLLPAKRPVVTSEREKALVEELEHWKTLYQREERNNEKLRKQMAELQLGRLINPESNITQFVASVVGMSSDLSSGLLRVRAGESLGVTAGTVAVTDGVQIVGRVLSVSGPTALVQPITRKGAPKIAGRVMVDEPNNIGLQCLLEPIGTRFRAAVQAPDASAANASRLVVEPGQTVRLDDDRWPESSQRFVVGKVESVEVDPANPLRVIAIVVPTVEIERISEMTLRIVNDRGEERAGGGGKP